MTRYDLTDLPTGSHPNKVEVAPATKDGRRCLRIALDAASRAGKPGVDYVDQPSFLLLPEVVTDATVEVDISARLLPDAPDYARGFIGLAYRVQPDLSSYESVYIRPTNGLRHAPEPPRSDRAVQYYAFPDYPFDVLRETEPGRFEAGADIGLDLWHRLSVTFTGTDFVAAVDGTEVLRGAGKIPARPGRIGLWVDIGTEGFFANLGVRAS
ncbi:MAG: hypothetical protein RLZZ528_1094 [Pseudomonadota bacterium]|jgi:hypothetical protein